MKTGIITFHRAINYGAVLQTYALQMYLNNYGYDAEVIDYRCDYMENFYKIFSVKNKSIKQVIRGLMNFGYAYKKKKAFYRFLNQNVQKFTTSLTLGNQIINMINLLQEVTKFLIMRVQDLIKTIF